MSHRIYINPVVIRSRFAARLRLGGGRGFCYNVPQQARGKMKKNLGVKNGMFSMPVLMIGTARPICFDTCRHVYRVMGEVVAPAFSCGKELM